MSVLFSGAQTVNYIKFSPTGLLQKPGSTLNSLYKPDNKKTLRFPGLFAVIPKDYYTRHFGIICKKELAIEKLTKIPFRFRLGSLQQCNYLEGKR